MSKVTVNFPKIDRLISDFESGHSVHALLDEINADQSFLWTLGHEYFDDFDYFFVIHQDQIFVMDDDICEYFDKDYLLNLKDEEVREFVESQIQKEIESDIFKAIHFHENSHSVVSAIGEPRGQSGIWFSNLQITTSREERVQSLIQEGYLFLSEDPSLISDDILICKYQKFVRNRLS